MSDYLTWKSVGIINSTLDNLCTKSVRGSKDIEQTTLGLQTLHILLVYLLTAFIDD